MKLKHLILRTIDKIMGRTSAKLWVEALRSGQYKQDQNRLETHRGLCCLGVACKVAESRGIKVAYERRQDRDSLKGRDLSDQRPVQDWLGLATKSGSQREGPNLTTLNDGSNKAGRMYSFAEIADIIESRPPGLFTE